ncbi:MAG: hypothetical protein AVDCRST_MAG41-4360, partial [uncultured Corynebacteriales bacterium]
ALTLEPGRHRGRPLRRLRGRRRPRRRPGTGGAAGPGRDLHRDQRPGRQRRRGRHVRREHRRGRRVQLRPHLLQRRRHGRRRPGRHHPGRRVTGLAAGLHRAGRPGPGPGDVFRRGGLPVRQHLAGPQRPARRLLLLPGADRLVHRPRGRVRHGQLRAGVPRHLRAALRRRPDRAGPARRGPLRQPAAAATAGPRGHDPAGRRGRHGHRPGDGHRHGDLQPARRPAGLRHHHAGRAPQHRDRQLVPPGGLHARRRGAVDGDGHPAGLRRLQAGRRGRPDPDARERPGHRGRGPGHPEQGRRAGAL